MEDVMRIGEVATALGVSVDTLRRWDRDGRVQFERRGRRRYMVASELARLLRERDRDGAGGARNRLEGIVLSVRHERGHARVDIACGPHRIVSLMTGEAALALGLQAGDPATAVIPPTTVLVERS